MDPGRDLGRLGKRSLRRLGRAAGRFMPERREGGLPASLVRAKRIDFDRRRAFGASDLATLEAMLHEAEAVLTLRQAAAAPALPSRTVALRHDMDHDLENSLRFARWEADHGWRATYMVLPSDWYWRPPGAHQPSQLAIRTLQQIQALGHEIGLHNNVLATALRTGSDPVAVLAEELEALRSRGFDVVGVARHGDPLCRSLGFLNDDVFSRPPDGSSVDPIEPEEGSPQTRRLPEGPDGASLPGSGRLYQPVDPATMGILYDAYRLPMPLYESDTGGRWLHSLAETAMRFGRSEGACQVLIHPVWWALRGEPCRPRS